MSETYVLRRHGSDAPLRVRAKTGQTAREVYDSAIAMRDLDPATCLLYTSPSPRD